MFFVKWSKILLHAFKKGYKLKKYKTIYCESQLVTNIKKSKFIATVSPTKNIEEALSFIKSMQKKYADATHNVFAFRVIDENIFIERQSDDGEPSGTAGMPILEVLRGESLLNITAVVTRYYGGTLLGTGGLNRAYGQTTKDAIKEIIEKAPYILYRLCVSYSQMGQIQYEIIKENHILYETIYADNVEYLVYTKEEEGENFLKRMIDLTGNNIKITEIKFDYGFWYNGKFMIDPIN